MLRSRPRVSMVVGAVLAIALLLLPRRAPAEDLRAHGTLGLAHAAGAPQSREFGFGIAGSASLELPLGAALGLEGKLGGIVLAQGDAPRDPRLASPGTGTAVLGTVGLRIRPFTPVAGPWASAGIGGAQTGDRTRFVFDSAIGWDFRVQRDGRLDVGPYIGFDDIVQSDDGLRPNDAYVVSMGIHVGLGVAAKKQPPSDRDKDGILDGEDACPDAPGIRTSDPKTNGCPRGDRDKDGVFDDEDACPDVFGIRTDDPKTNGCPRGDRDQDGVFDDEDACPDVPGIRTIDPKTNGCPPASDSVRVEADKILFDEVILFDLDSPRVRHASFDILKKLAEFIIATPDILEVSIEGHADATGTEAHNLVLSRERAENVRRHLVQNGVDGSRIKAEAYGRSRLKVQTNRAEAKNRRVEFWITRTRPGNVTPGGGQTNP